MSQQALDTNNYAEYINVGKYYLFTANTLHFNITYNNNRTHLNDSFWEVSFLILVQISLRGGDVVPTSNKLCNFLYTTCVSYADSGDALMYHWQLYYSNLAYIIAWMFRKAYSPYNPWRLDHHALSVRNEYPKTQWMILVDLLQWKLFRFPWQS
jgi:hypothetical protein